MDSLHFIIAIGPLAMYLLLLGGINLAPRPLMTSGGRDLAALGIGLAGLVIAGPLELFFPETFAVAFGYITWILLVIGYALGWLLLVLMCRPRIVIYNLTHSQLRPTLAEVVSRLDSETRWAGDSAVLPNLGVQFLIEPFSPVKNVQLIAVGSNTNLDNWHRLEVELYRALEPIRTVPNPIGLMLTIFGTMLTALVIYRLIQDPTGILQSLETMLYLKPDSVPPPP